MRSLRCIGWVFSQKKGGIPAECLLLGLGGVYSICIAREFFVTPTLKIRTPFLRVGVAKILS